MRVIELKNKQIRLHFKKLIRCTLLEKLFSLFSLPEIISMFWQMVDIGLPNR